MANVPDAGKTQFEAVNKEFDAVRVKFGVPRAGPAGWRRRRTRRRWWLAAVAAPPANPNDLVARAGTVKAQIMSFQDMPSDTLVKQYNDVKLALPRAIAEANALLTKAMTLSQALKKYDVALTVPSPVK